MKKAIGYVRISTEGQSNHSLQGQAQDITRYCERNNIELTNIFEEDGQSAKNFDRISWEQLEKCIKQNHKDINYLIVWKYDRFSRNLLEALQMIEKIEKVYGIFILSVCEYIGVHPESPMFFQTRTQILFQADVELKWIKYRTTSGIHNALINGYYPFTPPFGYTRAWDKDKKPKLAINEPKAAIVQSVFRMFLSGIGMEDIRRKLKPEGLTVQGNSAIRKILSNPAYAGFVKVSSFYDEPEKMIEAKHDAIIDKATWWAAQAKLSGRQINRQDNDEVPLRGSLHCECGRVMTAGNSKGKTKYYWYYLCNVCRENFSGNKLHAQFDEMLQEMTLQPHQLQYLQNQALYYIKQNLSANEKRLQQTQKELKEIEAKIDTTEDKYLSGLLDDAAYQKWKVRLENDRHRLAAQVDALNIPIKETWSRHESSMHKLEHIDSIFHDGPLEKKKSFISLVFDNRLGYADGIYRTPYLTPVFRHKELILKEKRLLEVQQPLLNSQDFILGREEGNIIEPLIRLIAWANDIKAA